MSEPWVPAPFQLRAAEMLVENSFTGLFMKPGLRKTSITLAAYKILKRAELVKAALVVAPLRVCFTSWPSEIRKWNDFKHFSYGILHGDKKADVLKEKHDFYIINYEGLEWLFSELRKYKKYPFDFLVIDESTKVRNTSTKRFRLLRANLTRFKRRVILTGSPMPRSMLDLFGQLLIMDRGVSLGPYVTHFRNEYFFKNPYDEREWLPKPDTPERIKAILAPRVFYAHEDDHLDLPPILEKDVWIDLPKEARAKYDEFEARLSVELKAGRVTAVNTGVMTLKCRQIANGGVYLDGAERVWEIVHEAKTDALEDVLEELSGQPAIVTYDFLHDLDRLKRRFGKDVPHIGKGGVPPKELPTLLRRWDNDELPFIFVSPQSLAHGVDGLQRAGRAIVWASLTYDYENYEQLVRRLYRSGQQERVSVIHLIARDTVDEAQMKNLRTKERNQNTFLNSLKDYMYERQTR